MRLLEILQTLHNITESNKNISEIFICGGIPRDKVIGTTAHKYDDLDITNGDASIKYAAEEFALQFSHKYTIKKTVANDGHVSIHLNNFKVDFSSNFIVPNIDRYLKDMGIESATSMQKEIFSRDFTCNALLLSLDLREITDLTGRGMADIEKKLLKTCLPPEISLSTNVNRIPRIIYLACKLGFRVEPSILEWVRKNPQYIQQCKAKYVTEKLTKALSYDKDKAIALIGEMNLWNYIPISDQLFPYYEKAIARVKK